MAQFDEFIMRCNINAKEIVTSSRFKKVLNDEIRRELVLRSIDTLNHASTFAHNFELASRSQYVRCIDNHPPLDQVPPQRNKSFLGRLFRAHHP